LTGIRSPIAACLLLGAAATPLRPLGSFETEILDAHNAVREEVSVPPLRWSNKLESAARKWAGHLLASGRFEHQARPPYGENLFEARGAEASPTEAVAAWADEAVDYSYRTNTCRATCGHYTQVVWRNTREVGCAEARRGPRQVVVCEYEPPGNWQGQRPY